MADTSLYFDFLKRRDTVTPHTKKVAGSFMAMARSIRVSSVISVAAIATLIAGIGGLIAHAIALTAALAPMIYLVGLIPAAAIGAAAGIGTLIIATKGLGTALQEGAKGAEAYKKLTKSGKQLVDALKAQKSAWQDLQRAVQRATFRNVGRDIRMLSTAWLPMLKVQLSSMGQAWNIGFRTVATLAKSKSFVADINATLADTVSFMRGLARSWAPFLSGFRHFARIGASFLPGIGKWIREIGQRFETWSAGVRQSGRMAGAFAHGLAVLKDFWAIVKNLGASIMAIFRAGNPAGYLGSWVKGTAALREWLESAEGQRKMANAMKTLRNIASMLVDALAKLSVGLITVLGEGTSVSDSMAVMGVVAGFLADHLDTLALALPYLTALFLGMKTIQAAHMVTAAASLPITIAQTVVQWKLTVALRAQTKAMAAQMGMQRGSIATHLAQQVATLRTTVATAASTVATKVAAAATAVWAAVTRTATTATHAMTVANLRAAAASAMHRTALVAVAVATRVVTAAQWLWNLAMMANPIGLIIIAIIAVVAVIVILWTKSAGFRDFFIGVWNFIWQWLKRIGHWFANDFANFFINAFNGLKFALRAFNTFWINVWNGIKFALQSFNTFVITRWNNIVKFFSGLPGRISGAVKGIWNGLVAGFRNAINTLIRMWNNFSLTLGGGSVLGFTIPSVTLDTPNVPFLDTGGTILRSGLAVVHKGETVVPLGGGRGRTERVEVVFRVEGGDNEFKRLIKKWVRVDGGGNVQVAFGRR